MFMARLSSPVRRLYIFLRLRPMAPRMISTKPPSATHSERHGPATWNLNHSERNIYIIRRRAARLGIGARVGSMPDPDPVPSGYISHSYSIPTSSIPFNTYIFPCTQLRSIHPFTATGPLPLRPNVARMLSLSLSLSRSLSVCLSVCLSLSLARAELLIKH